MHGITNTLPPDIMSGGERQKPEESNHARKHVFMISTENISLYKHIPVTFSLTRHHHCLIGTASVKHFQTKGKESNRMQLKSLENYMRRKKLDSFPNVSHILQLVVIKILVKVYFLKINLYCDCNIQSHTVICTYAKQIAAVIQVFN